MIIGQSLTTRIVIRWRIVIQIDYNCSSLSIHLPNSLHIERCSEGWHEFEDGEVRGVA